jgi:tetratricopeptide (TPR) repeat protein
MQTSRGIASLIAICFALTSAPSVCWADQPSGHPDSKVAQGEALAEQAYSLYKEGRFSEAVAAYLRAYEMTGSSVILFNVANIYDRKLRELDLAAEYYRRYLRAPDATPELVRKANDRLEALKLQTTPAPPSSGAPTPAPTTPVETGPDPTWRTLGLVVGGLGVISLGVSGAFAVQAKNKDDDAKRYCTGKECSDPRGPSLGDEAVTAANVSTITFATGLAALAGGAFLFFAAPARGAPTTGSTRGIRAVPNLGPQTAGLTLVGGWL